MNGIRVTSCAHYYYILIADHDRGRLKGRGIAPRFSQFALPAGSRQPVRQSEQVMK